MILKIVSPLKQSLRIINILKKSKPTSSADTFAISIESVSTHIDKEILKDSPLLTRTKSEDCISSAEQVRNIE